MTSRICNDNELPSGQIKLTIDDFIVKEDEYWFLPNGEIHMARSNASVSDVLIINHQSSATFRFHHNGKCQPVWFD